MVFSFGRSMREIAYTRRRRRAGQAAAGLTDREADRILAPFSIGLHGNNGIRERRMRGFVTQERKR